MPELRALGRKHATYGVGATHYDVAGRALVDTLAAALGAGFTPELRRAWTEVYGRGVHISGSPDIPLVGCVR